MPATFRYSLLVWMLSLAGASSGNDAQDTWREERLSLGQETYEQACASCHDTGKDGAPLTGNPKHWSNRSDLWEAVLFKHANSGYLEMPGKGGHSELTENSVNAAVEYMLSVTFPDLPRD